MTTYNKFKSSAFQGVVYSDTFDSLNNTISISNGNGTTNLNGKINITSNQQSTNFANGALVLSGGGGLGLAGGNINMFGGAIETNGGGVNCGNLNCASLNSQGQLNTKTLNITSNEQAINFVTGALQLPNGGGIGMAGGNLIMFNGMIDTNGGQIHCGGLYCGSLNPQGQLNITDQTDANSWANASFVTSGGIGVLKSIYQSPFGGSAILNNVYSASINNNGNITTDSLTTNSISCPSLILDSATFTDEATTNCVTVGNDLLIGGSITVAGEIHNNNNIYCQNLTCRNDITYPSKTIGYFYINSVPYPIIKSCYNTLLFYGSLNLQNLLNVNTCYLLLYPYYSVSFYNNKNNVIQTINNATGTDILYSQITLSSNLCYKFIIKYKNTTII